MGRPVNWPALFLYETHAPLEALTVNIQTLDLPKTERVGSILYCDKLPYPTDYIKQDLYLVVFVPNDALAIAKARTAIDILIRQGRLREGDVRLRMAADDYDFNGMVDGFLQEATTQRS